MSRRRSRNRDHGALVPGFIMIAVGLVFLLDRFDVLVLRQVSQYWPMILIVIGLGKLLRPERGRRSIFVLLMGIWLQINTLGLYGFDWGDSWPLLIIFVGASFVFDALVDGGRPAPPPRPGVHTPPPPPPPPEDMFASSSPPGDAHEPQTSGGGFRES